MPWNNSAPGQGLISDGRVCPAGASPVRWGVGWPAIIIVVIIV